MSQATRLIPSSGPGSGTVTSISEGTGITLTPNPITTTGTVALTVPVIVADGGTGATSFTAFAPIVGGTTSTNPFQSAATGISNVGYVLTSTGAGSIPTWQAASAGGSSGPVFGAQLQTPVANATGAGVTYVLGTTQALTTLYDTTSNFFPGDGLGTPASYTAPFTGKYYLELQVSMQTGATVNDRFTLNIVTPARTYTEIFQYDTTGSNNQFIAYPVVADLTAGDVVTFEINVAGSGSTQTVTVGQNAQTYVWGFQILAATGGSGGTTNFVTNSGTAIQAAGVLNVLGDTTSITTSGSGNTITISAISGITAWADEGVSFLAVPAAGYFIDAASVTATLPASPVEGDSVAFAVDANTNTFVIRANTGQKIRIGSAINSGTAGSATNNAQGDSVTLVYRSTGAVWIATSVIGTWTLS